MAISKLWSTIKPIGNEYINLPSVGEKRNKTIRPFGKARNINS